MASWGHFQQAEVRSRPTATSTCAASSSAEMSSLAPLPTMPGGAIFDWWWWWWIVQGLHVCEVLVRFGCVWGVSDT